MICEHIEEVMSLLKRIAVGNIEDKLQKQITWLRDEVRKIEAKIDKQRFLIRKLAPTLAEELITKGEAHQLRTRFEAEQDTLEKKRSGILEQIRRIEDGTLLECSWAKHFMPYVGQTSFSRKDVAMLIEAIYLHKDKHIEICFVHDPEFRYIQQVLE